MKICAYVLAKHAKATYAQESYNVRQNAGMAVVVDILKRNGRNVDYAGIATVHKYDIVLVSITSDCDWWPFLAERVRWQKGTYKVVAGGAGVLNVRPFLPFVDYFVMGRAEGVIEELIVGSYSGSSVIESRTFSDEKKYTINQVKETYPYEVKLESGKTYVEGSIGCKHKCFFCGYTWHRKNINNKEFRYDDLWSKNKDVEMALLDLSEGVEVNFNKLRTTAIDGLSERIRFSVNKKITKDMVREFLIKLHTAGRPHQVKFYNIVGYPTETEDDWFEFLDDISYADNQLEKSEKQTSILLHSTPFRAMPATPLACAPMSYKNYRGAVSKNLGRELRGNLFYQGRALWAVESMGTESLPTVIQSAIILRGDERDADNIVKVASSSKFARANMNVKQETLEKYFDVGRLFAEQELSSLATRYLSTSERTKLKAP